MATFQLPARRLALAGGFAVALALALAPVAADLTAAPTAHTVAACITTKSGYSYSLSCTPDVVPGGNGTPVGAPTQQDLTDKNSRR
jgi:hypothetical protein